MPLQEPAQTISAVGNSAVLSPKPQQDTEALITISGIYAGFKFVVEATYDGTNYAGVQCMRYDTGVNVNGGCKVAPDDNATAFYRVPLVQQFSALRVRCTDLTSGSVTVLLASNSFFTSAASSNAVLSGVSGQQVKDDSVPVVLASNQFATPAAGPATPAGGPGPITPGYSQDRELIEQLKTLNHQFRFYMTFMMSALSH